MKASTGTTPAGAETEEQASRYVREMFGRVANRYDLANHLLSMNIDRAWRRRTVEKVAAILRNPEARVVDLCCGTGDLTRELARERIRQGGGIVFGSDFSYPMLAGAALKLADEKHPSALFEADALCLPLADASVDLITCAFGFRNLTNYDAGLREFRRVLRTGGMLTILEFSQPPNPWFASLYRFYSGNILPRLGGMITGAPDAYTYLPESVRKFPGAEELARRFENAGFSRVEFERLTGGIVALHTGRV